MAEDIRVDVLDEFDPKLDGYKASAFVSIHADSCSVDMTGFKVASAENGSDASKQLEECLWTRYEAETGLPRHLVYDHHEHDAVSRLAQDRRDDAGRDHRNRLHER